MKTIQLIIMAFRYFIRYFRRYLFLFVALSFGYGIITSITSIQAGMENNVYTSARSHYAGDVTVVGRTKKRIGFHIDNVRQIREILWSANIKAEKLVVRTQLGKDGVIYFNGESIRQKYTLGVNWDNEADYFRLLSYSQGEFGNWNKEDGIVVSTPVAQEMNLIKGDSVLLEVKTITGQVNTGSFVVQAVVDDDSIFGYYKCYVDQRTLNNLIGFNENEASSIGIYLKDGAHMDREALKIIDALRISSLNTAPLVRDKYHLIGEYDQSWEGIRYFAITLPIYLSEISQLLTAINLIAYFLYCLMLLIIIVSVAVTFRLILHEREKEIGTLRSIGFLERNIVFLLMMETIFLFAFSLVTGFIFARFIIWILGFFSFGIIPSFEIFMKNGRLVPLFTLRTTLINVAIVLAVLLPTVAIPVHNASRKPLSLILTGGKD